MELTFWDSVRDSFRTTNENSIGTKATAPAVGLDRMNSKNNYILIRYTFTAPGTKEGVNITSLEVTKLEFKAASGKSYSIPQGGRGKNAIDSDLYVYGVISDDDSLGPTALKDSKDKFLVEETLLQQGATKNTISVEGINIKLTPGKDYYLYLFTQNPGGSYRTAYLYWPNSPGQEDDTLTITCNYATYTKIDDPSVPQKVSGYRTPGDSVTITWNSVNDSFLKGYVIAWTGALENSAFVAAGETSYTISLSDATRGESVSFYIAAKHSENEHYDSGAVFCGAVTINSLPVINNFDFKPNTIIPKVAVAESVVINIDSTGYGELTHYYKLEGATQYEKIVNSEVKIQNTKTFYLKVVDGLGEESEVVSWVTKAEKNITINTPPSLTEFFINNYDFDNNTLTLSTSALKTGDKLLVQLQNGAFKTSWIEYEDKLILTDQNLSALAPPFSQLTINGKIQDTYKDESEELSSSFKPTINFPKDFLAKINLSEEIANSWTIDQVVLKDPSGALIPNSCSNRIITITNPNDLTSGSNHTLSFSLYQNKNVFWSIATIIQAQSFVKFTGIPNCSLTWYNPFEAWLGEKKTIQYNIGTLGVFGADQVELVMEYGGNSKRVALTKSSSNDNTLYLNSDARSLFDFRDAFDEQFPYNGTVTGIKWHLEYKKNDATFISKENVINFNFDYIVQLPKLDIESTVHENSVAKIILENFSIASQLGLLFTLQVDDGDGFKDYEQFQLNYDTNWSKPTTENGELQLPTINEEFTSRKFEEIGSRTSKKWRIVTQLSTKTVTKNSETIITDVIYHTAPSNFSILRGTWSTDGAYALLDYSVLLNTNGEPEISWELESNNGSISQIDNQLKYIPPKNVPGPYAIIVKIGTKYDYLDSYKTALSNQFILYIDGPTVSYRSHCLGINGQPTRWDTVLEIESYVSQKTDRHLVYLKNPSTQSGIFIDLLTSKVDGAIIDCGTWDADISDSVPTGLARVAYTGEVADLVENEETIVVFSGGTSLAPEENNIDEQEAADDLALVAYSGEIGDLRERSGETITMSGGTSAEDSQEDQTIDSTGLAQVAYTGIIGDLVENPTNPLALTGGSADKI